MALRAIASGGEYLQRPAFNMIHSVSPMSREREARQGIGDSSLRRGALVALVSKKKRFMGPPPHRVVEMSELRPVDRTIAR